MNIDQKLDALRHITPVDAPPFLLTRIQQRINSLNSQTAPRLWKWSFAVVGLLLLFVNIALVINSTSSTNTPAINTLVNTMNLSATNELYHE